MLLKASSPIEINNGGMILHFLGLPNVNISVSGSLLDVDIFAGGGCLVGFCCFKLNLKGLFNGCCDKIGVGWSKLSLRAFQCSLVGESIRDVKLGGLDGGRTPLGPGQSSHFSQQYIM